jgi:hypothetical protein
MAAPLAGRRLPERIETLVVSGGGMRGIASLGAAVALRRAGVLKHVTTLVGTSAGALVAAALALDRAGVTLLHDLSKTTYSPDIDLARLLGSYGIDSGRHLDRWIAELMGGQRYTFRDVRALFGVDLVVCVTNVTERRAEYLGPATAPDMDVGLALRMSCSIPLYFSAVTHGGCVYVDGAVSDNFPVEWAAEQYGGDTLVGIGFRPRRAPATPDASLEDYLGALVECAVRRRAPAPDARILQLDTGAKSAFDFSMSHRDMKRLFAAGSKQAREWHKKRV